MTAAATIGLGLSFAAAFALSLVHAALSNFSKISLSGFLEERQAPTGPRVLKNFDELRVAVEFWRMIVILAVLVNVVSIFRRAGLWPLWLFLGAAGTYAIALEIAARMIGTAKKEALLAAFLPAAGLILTLSAPVLAVFRWTCAREKDENAAEENREASDEEIRTFIDEAKEEGIIEGGEDDLLRSVVEFGDTVVREIMTPRLDMVCIPKEATIQKLRNLIIAEKYSRIPVYKDRVDNMEGIVVAKDLLPFSERSFDEAAIEPLIRPAIFIPESMRIADLLDEFQKSKQKLALVVDEHGGVSGLVTMEDVVEEIVGEIHDEYDTEEPQISETGPGEYLVSGTVKVEELEDVLSLELGEDDFITASGLVTHKLGRLPAKGETVTLPGASLEVVDVDQKRIKKIKLKKTAGPFAGSPKE